MIYFGKRRLKKFKIGVLPYKRKWPVAKGLWIYHYFLIFYFGYLKFWIGYNALDRIVRNKVYRLDKKLIFFEKK